MIAPADMGPKAPSPEGPDDAVSQEDFDRAEAAGRFHNRSPHSPEALAEALSDVRDSLMSLEARLVMIAADLARQVEGSEQKAAQTSLLLAREMADMGAALARRVRTLEHGGPLPEPPLTASPEPLVFAPPVKPKPRRRRRGLAIGIGLAVVLAAALAGAWYWRESLSPSPVTSPPAKIAPVAPPPPIASDAPPAPTPAPPVKHAWTGHKPWRPPAPKTDLTPANGAGYGAYHGPN
jgi:hypothetical protein